MSHSEKEKLSINSWYQWTQQVHQRSDAAKRGEFSSRLKLNSKTLVFDNMNYVYGPMIVGIERSAQKRRTLWFLDVTKEEVFEVEKRDRSNTVAVMRMEFWESKSPMTQTDNLGLYDGLSVSYHFIERLFERNFIRSKAEFSSSIISIMAGIVRLDTKNLADDFLSLGHTDLGLVSELGVFFIALESHNSSGRMILKTFISFNDMTAAKKLKLLNILYNSPLYKKTSTTSRLAVISSRPEDGNYEVYDDFVKSYVISVKYIPPKAVISESG